MLSSSGTELCFLCSFNEQILKHQTTIKSSAALGMETENCKGLDAEVEAKLPEK